MCIPIISKDDDSDIIGLQVEGHTSNSWSELDHLSGLNFIEANDSGNTVTDTNHSSKLFNIILYLFNSTTWLMPMIFSWITLDVSAIPSFLVQKLFWTRRNNPLILCWIIIDIYIQYNFH